MPATSRSELRQRPLTAQALRVAHPDRLRPGPGIALRIASAVANGGLLMIPFAPPVTRSRSGQEPR